MLSHPRRRKSQLRFEALEDRCVPAIVTWTGAVSVYWSNPANWSGNKVPVGGDTLVFDASASGHYTNINDLSGPLLFPFEVSGLRLEQGGYILEGNPIAIGSAAGVTRVGGSSITDTLTFDITLSTDQTWLVEQPLLVTGAIKGGGNLTKVGQGTLRLDGDSTYTGSTDIAAGTVRVESDLGLGSRNTGTTVESGASLIYDGGSNYETQVILNNHGSVEVATGELKVKTGENSGPITVGDSASLRFKGSYVLYSGTTLKGAGMIQIDPSQPSDHFKVTASISVPSLTLANLATVDVQDGVFTVQGGSSSGTFNVANGASVLIAHQFDLNAGSAFAGTGLIQIQPASPGPIVNVNADMTMPNLEVGANATLELHTGRLKLGTVKTLGKIRVHSGSALSIEDTFDSNPGSNLENLPGGVVEINTVEPVSFDSGQINNSGRLSWLGGGNLRLGSASSLNNLIGGLIELNPVEPTSGAVPTIDLADGGTLSNAAGGLIRINPVEPTSGIEFAGGAVNNSGTLDWISGNISLAAGASLKNLAGGLITIHPVEPTSGEAPTIDLVAGTVLNNAVGATIEVQAAGPVAITEGGIFENDGAVNVHQQSLIVGDGVSTGGFTADFGAIINFVGDFGFNAGTSFAGAGSIRVDPATPCCAATINGDVDIPHLIVGAFGVLNVQQSLSSANPIQNDGTLGGSGAVHAKVINRGTLSPGASPGHLTIDGDLVLDPAGKLVLDVGGTSAGTEYDQLAVNGMVTLGGTLEINLINGYVPAIGSTFHSLQFGANAGAFAHASGNRFGDNRLAPYITANELDLIAQAPAVPPFVDEDGDTYNVRLRGPGTASVFLNDPDKNGMGSIDQLLLQGTDEKLSRLTISMRRGHGANGLGTIGEIDGAALKSLTISRSDLAGWLGTALNFSGNIGTLTARSVGDATIQAGGIGKLRVTGDFKADVTVTGAGGLGRAIIGGTVSDSVFNVMAGSVGYFRAAAFINSELFVGFTPSDSAHPLAGGTFVSDLSIGSFNVTRSRTPGFVNSVVAAATIDRARLANVLTDNSGSEFGLIGQTIGSVRIGKPAFVFGPSVTGVGDFHVVDM